MAIAYGSGVDGGITPGGTSLTWSHTITGSDRILFVGVVGWTTDNITGVTYNGVPLTLINKGAASGELYSYLFYLIAPATGTNNVVVSATGDYIFGISAYFTGVNQSLTYTGGSPTDNQNVQTSTTPASTYAQSVTTIADNSFAIMNLRESAGRSTTAGADTTKIADGGGGGNGNHMYYSTAAKTPAGTRTLNVSSFSGASPSKFAGVIASFSPVATTTSHIKSADGMLLANIKSIGGIAIANVKSASGIANS